MTDNEVYTHLDDLADFITSVDPDILILQEVDRNSLRSGYIDQTQYLLDATNLQLWGLCLSTSSRFFTHGRDGPH